MDRYLFEASYSVEGIKGLVAAGAKSRVNVVNDLAASVGGTVVSLDFANGGTDVFLICDLPGDDAATALTLAVVGSGALGRYRLVKLQSAEQVEAASARKAQYVPPGG